MEEEIANVVGEHANFKSAAEDNINALFGDDDSTQELEENNAEVESFSENYTNSMDEMDHITSEAKKILENPINDISFGKRIQGDDDNFEIITLRLPPYISQVSDNWHRGSLKNPDDKFDESYRIKAELTIRQKKDEQSGHSSNTRILKWSDGSYSFLIGTHMFELVKTDIPDDLALFDWNFDGETRALIGKKRIHQKVIIRPYSIPTQTEFNKALTMISNIRNVKEPKVKMAQTSVDPDLLKAELERDYQAKVKMARKAEMKRRSTLELMKSQIQHKELTRELLEYDSENEDDEFYTNQSSLSDELFEHESELDLNALNAKKSRISDSEEEQEEQVYNSPQPEQQQQIDRSKLRQQIFDSDSDSE